MLLSNHSDDEEGKQIEKDAKTLGILLESRKEQEGSWKYEENDSEIQFDRKEEKQEEIESSEDPDDAFYVSKNQANYLKKSRRQSKQTSQSNLESSKWNTQQ